MSIALSLGNNLTTNGVFKPAAVNNTSVNNVTDFASVPAGGALFLLSTQTASASASISFTSGIDSTYDSYVFKFIDINPSVDGNFTFQGSTDGGSTYGVTLTSTFFRSQHNEDDSATSFVYRTGEDLAQSTSFQPLITDIGSDTDESGVGTLQLFNPSSTTFVKHFIARTQDYVGPTPISREQYVAGYFNTTSAIDAIKFQPASGTFDGIIKMYGVKKS